MEKPPVFTPEETPTSDQLKELALRLLSDVARFDPQIADRLRHEGLGSTSAERLT